MFVLGSLSKPKLTFVGKAKANTSGAPLPLGETRGLTHKHYTSLERLFFLTFQQAKKDIVFVLGNPFPAYINVCQ